jgi:molybdate transport system ATP-binding protein
MLSLTRPEGISALNILPATVTEVHRGEGPGVAVALLSGSDRLLARITRRSADALGLVPGTACHAVLKSVAVSHADVGA